GLSIERILVESVLGMGVGGGPHVESPGYVIEVERGVLQSRALTLVCDGGCRVSPAAVENVVLQRQVVHAEQLNPVRPRSEDLVARDGNRLVVASRETSEDGLVPDR